MPDGDEEEEKEDAEDESEASDVCVAEASKISVADDAVEATVLVEAACLPLGPQPSR